MSTRIFATLLAALSFVFGICRYLTGIAPAWQVPLLAFVGFIAPYVIAFVAWMLIAPSDACGVVKEIWRKIQRRDDSHF